MQADMVNTERKLNPGTILLFVFLITPFFSISGIKNVMGASIYQAWQIISICFLGLIFLLRYTQIKIDWCVGLFSLYQIVILFSSIFNNGMSLGIVAVIVASMLLFILLQTDFYYEIIKKSKMAM